MSIHDLKITQGDYSNRDVASAPDRLIGTASANKNIFDRLIKDLIAGRFNSLVGALEGEKGAGNIGAEEIQGVAGITVQAILAGLKALIDERYTIAQANNKFDAKFDKSDAQSLVKTVDIDTRTGTITVRKFDGTTQSWDTAMEKIALDVSLEGDEFVLGLADGTKQRVNLSKFIDTYSFGTSNTIDFGMQIIGNSKRVLAEVRPGTIKMAQLAPELAQELVSYKTQAEEAAVNSEASAANSTASSKSASASATRAKGSENAASASVTLAKASENAARASQSAAMDCQEEAALSAELAKIRAEKAKYEADRASSIVGGNFATKVELEAAKNEAISESVPRSRTINAKPMNADIVLMASDVGAADAQLANVQASVFKAKARDAGIDAFDIVVRTQAEFDALLASPTWFDAVSVCFVGNGGTLKFTKTDGTTCKIPQTVKQIQGVNRATIEITNYSEETSGDGAIWYRNRPTGSDYYMDGISLNCSASSGSVFGFSKCAQMTNCTCTATGKGYGFSSCIKVSDCTGRGGVNGFLNCSQLMNCTAAPNSIGTDTCSGYNHCNQITNCIGTGNDMGFSDCTQLINCTGTGKGTNLGIGYGYYNCTQLINCIGTGISKTGSISAGFFECTQLMNCQGTGKGLGAGYSYYSCKYLNGCMQGATASTSGFLAGTNTYIDTLTVAAN